MSKNKEAKVLNMNGEKTTTEEQEITKSPETLNLVPHPNVIFAVKVDKSKTKSGIILPEGTSKGTPIAEIFAVGDNVRKQYSSTPFSLEPGDVVYVDGSYVRPAIIDGVEGVILMADGIFGKVKTKKEEE